MRFKYLSKGWSLPVQRVSVSFSSMEEGLLLDQAVEGDFILDNRQERLNNASHDEVIEETLPQRIISGIAGEVYNSVDGTSVFR